MPDIGLGQKPLDIGAGQLQTLIATLQSTNVKLGQLMQVGAPTWTSPPPGATIFNSVAAGTYRPVTGQGYVATLNINTAATGTVALSDATGAPLGVFDTSSVGHFTLNYPFTAGLVVVQTGSADVSILTGLPPAATTGS